jgi:hypothetical protein
VRNNVLGHGFALECDFAVDVAAQHSGPSAYFIVIRLRNRSNPTDPERH